MKQVQSRIRAGVHEIAVTHTGVRDGEAFRTVESRTDDIAPKTVTVITISPGRIGAIQIEGPSDGP